jgi:hypothetical protein
MVSKLRRKSRAYRFGPYYCSGTRRNLGSPVKEDVIYSDWHAKLRLVQIDGFGFGHEFTLKVGFKPSQPGCLQLGRLASKGAEKSFREDIPRRTRRRKRGLRKGKRRSRVRHTRRTALPATVSKTSGHVIQHKIRVLEWNNRVGNTFRDQVLLAHEKGKFLPGEAIRHGYRKYESRWRKLHEMLLHGKPMSDLKLSADSALGHSFVSFLENRCKLYVRQSKGEPSGLSSLFAVIHRADLPKTTTPLRKRPMGTIESGRGGGSRRARAGKIMCRACGEQFITRGEECAVCYTRVHGSGSLPDRNVGVNNDAKKAVTR